MMKKENLRRSYSQVAKKKLNSEINQVFTTCPMKIKVLVVTSDKNPVVNVDVTVTFNDHSKYVTVSNKDGIAEFHNTPLNTPGLVTIEDEYDLIAKSFAANIFAACNEIKVDKVVQYLQSAVDYLAIKSAFKENYGKDVGKEIQSVFNKEGERTILNLLLIETKLIENNTKVVMGAFGL